MKRLFVLAVAIFWATSLAQADIFCGTTKHDNEFPLWNSGAGAFVSGNELYDWCTNPSTSNTCYGYIEAAADIYSNQNANTVCLPSGQAGVTAEEVVDVVKKYMTDHPETRHFTAISEILVALEEGFPCKSSS